jgi:hypothetical protein
MPDNKLQEAIKVTPDFRRSEGFISTYANNVLFETTVFDVKIVFGQITQPYGDKPFVEQRSAATLSWREAKIAALLLTMNVAMHENLFGALEIPEGNLPEGFQRTPEDRQLPLLKMMELVGERPPVKPNTLVSEAVKPITTQ